MSTIRIRALLAITLTLLVLPPLAASADPEHPVVLRYVAVDESCRITISIQHTSHTDPSSPLRMVILVEGLWLDDDEMDYTVRCGPYTGGIYCDDLTGSVAEGFSCAWGWEEYRASVSGAPAADGTFAGEITYLGRGLPATGLVLRG